MTSKFIGYVAIITRPGYDWVLQQHTKKQMITKVYEKRHTCISAVKQMRFWGSDFVKDCELLDDVLYEHAWLYTNRNTNEIYNLQASIVIKKVYVEEV